MNQPSAPGPTVRPRTATLTGMRASIWRRLGVAIALALAGCAALSAIAWGVVIVYHNNFSSPRDSQALKRSQGSHCGRTIKKGSLLVKVKQGKEVCGYYLPVQGDSRRPDLDVQARIKLQKPDSKHLRKHAFIGVGARSGPDTRYQLRVFPKGRKFLLKRSPHENGFNKSGKDNAINPIGSFNRLELQVFGNRAKAYVNGTKVAEAKDPKSDGVKGRKVEIVVGLLKKVQKQVRARVDSAEAGVPNL